MLNTLRVFGCTAYAYILKDELQKLDPKARKSILMGYGTETKGYRLYMTPSVAKYSTVEM